MPESYRSSGSTWLHFEGVFQKADVWVNGQHVKTHTSGYLGFDVSLDSVNTLAYGGGENSIAIRVDASFGSGHWYASNAFACDPTPCCWLLLALADPTLTL
jgi:beta-galactosidase